MTDVNGTIFDIKKFAVHDGPGIRTTVFMKGCPLRCRWCHNPESWERRPQILFYERNCIGCGKCFEACETGALRLVDGKRVYDRNLCEGCWKCTEVCYAEAQVKCGREVSVEEVILEVEKDRPFYENSGGGMTVSGGEPLAQFEFVKALFAEARARGLHTALDTSGYGGWQKIEILLPFVDLFLYDLKLIDPERHEVQTGVSNEGILENLRRLYRTGKAITIRMPVVPGCNDSEKDIRLLSAFLGSLNESRPRMELLPYHKLALSKYERLGGTYPLAELEAPPRERMEEIGAELRKSGAEIFIEG